MDKISMDNFDTIAGETAEKNFENSIYPVTMKTIFRRNNQMLSHPFRYFDHGTKRGAYGKFGGH